MTLKKKHYFWYTAALFIYFFWFFCTAPTHHPASCAYFTPRLHPPPAPVNDLRTTFSFPSLPPSSPSNPPPNPSAIPPVIHIGTFIVGSSCFDPRHSAVCLPHPSCTGCQFVFPFSFFSQSHEKHTIHYVHLGPITRGPPTNCRPGARARGIARHHIRRHCTYHTARRHYYRHQQLYLTPSPHHPTSFLLLGRFP